MACVWGKEQRHCVIWGKWQGPRQSSPATHTPDQPDETTLCFQPLDCDWAVLNPHRHVQGRIRYLLFSCHVSSSYYHINTCSKHPTTTVQNHINCLHFSSSEQWNPFLTGSVFCNQSLLVCAFNLISWCVFFPPFGTHKDRDTEQWEKPGPCLPNFIHWLGKTLISFTAFSSSFLGLIFFPTFFNFVLYQFI